MVFFTLRVCVSTVVVLCCNPVLLQLLPEGSKRTWWSRGFSNCCLNMYSGDHYICACHVCLASNDTYSSPKLVSRCKMNSVPSDFNLHPVGAYIVRSKPMSDQQIKKNLVYLVR